MAMPFLVKDGEFIKDLEQSLLDEFMGNSLYNVAGDARSPQKGRPHTPETIEKLREVISGFKHSEETIKRLSEIAKVRGMPKAVLEASANARRGKSLSPEHKAKVSAASKRHMTPEAREHLRVMNTGRIHSESDIERMKQIKRDLVGTACVINGVRYGCYGEAAEALGMKQGTVQYRVNSVTAKFNDWQRE